MRHLFSTRLRVILIIALVLSIGLTIVSGAVNQSIPSLLIQGLMAPLKAGANALTAQAEQFYGVMLQEEKEIITILAADTIRDQILEDVNRNFGLRTEAQAIICAVPVDWAFKI